MIKRLKPVLILLGVAAALGILLWVLVAFVLPKDEAGEDKGNSVVLMETDLTEADSVEIKNTFDHFTLKQQAIDHYYVDGKKDYEVDNDAILDFLKNLSSLTASKKVIDAPNAEQIKSYGLENPYGIVTVKDNADTYTFKIGATSASGAYYMQMGNDPAVYLIDGTIPDVALIARYQFYTDVMIDYSEESTDQETLKWFEISGTDATEKFRLVMNELGEDEVGASYLLTSPINHSASIVVQDHIFNLLTTLTTAAVVGDDTSPATLKKYGLDEPAYTFSFVQNDKVQTVHFGNTTEAGYQYCYTEGGKYIHNIETSNTEFMGGKLKDFCEDMIYTRSANNLKAIKVTGMDKNFQINIGDKDEEGNFYVTINNKVVDSELFSDFYAHVLMIGITDVGDKGEETTPYVSLEFTLKDDTVETMKFYPVSELKCYCEVNGTGSFWVTMMNVEKIVENAQKLYNGEVITTEW